MSNVIEKQKGRQKMKIITTKAEKMMIENIDNGKQRREIQNLNSDMYAETVVLTAQGRAEKIMKKV